MRWNESHRASCLPPILLCCLLLSSLLPAFLLPLTLAGSLRVSLSLWISSLFSPIHRSTFLLLSLLSQPPNPLSRSPRYVETEGTVHAIHTCSHVHAAPRFLLVAANTLRQRGRPLLIREEEEGEGGKDARTAEEIRFYPAAVSETFFPYLGITSKLK